MCVGFFWLRTGAAGELLCTHGPSRLTETISYCFVLRCRKCHAVLSIVTGSVEIKRALTLEH
jgi:hypothetical protein